MSTPKEFERLCFETDDVESVGVGTSRIAYLVMAQDANGQKKGPHVIKKFKPGYSVPSSWKLQDIVRCHARAQELLRDFCKEIEQQHALTVQHPLITAFESDIFDKRGRRIVQGGEKVALERFLRGDFVKFNSNSGYVNPSYSLPGQFSHYTWHVTQELVVCDLQGVYRPGRTSNQFGQLREVYHFTDPAINSTDRAWGTTDLGSDGIKAFFDSHKCGDLCEGYSKPVFRTRYSVRSVSVCKNTTYFRG